MFYADLDHGQFGVGLAALLAKEKLIHDAMVEKHAVGIATRFCPIA